MTSQQWQPGPDLFRVAPTGEEGKVGTSCSEGWVALCREDATFLKSYHWMRGVRYPDEDCPLQVYTSRRLIELETLGPLAIFYPDEEVVHREVWTVIAKPTDPADGVALRRLLSCPLRE